MTRTIDRAQLRNALLFAASVCVSLVILSREGWALWWLRRATYFTALAAVFAWVVRVAAWARARLRSPAEAWREAWPEVALAAGAMAALFLTHDGQFKVLSDEMNFVGLGRSLAFDWRFEFPEQVKLSLGAQHPLTYLFDKRPPLFAFLLALLDSLTGYRVHNVWLLNGAILGATVLVAGAALRSRLGRPWNLLAVGWALANPVVMLTASGATVEPLFGLLWVVAGACMLSVLTEPTAPTVGLLVATSLLLGLCRVEGAPLAALMLGGILVASPERRRILELLRDDPVVWLSPLAALPVLVQRTRLGDYNTAALTGGKEFGLQYLVANVKSWAAILRDGGHTYPFSAVVTCVEVGAFVALVVLVAARRTAMTRAEVAAFAIGSTLTAAIVALYSTYFWGQPTSQLCARFYALPLFLAGLAVPAVLARIPAVKARPAIAVVAVGLAFAHAFPSSHNGAFVGRLGPRVLHETLAEYLLAQVPERRLLVVTDLPAELAIHPVSAVTFETFKNMRVLVGREVDRKLYDEVLFVQEINVSNGRPSGATELAPDVEIVPVLERQYTGARFLRVSRWKR